MSYKKLKVSRDRYTDGGDQDYYDNGYRDEMKHHRQEKRLKNALRSCDLDDILDLEDDEL